MNLMSLIKVLQIVDCELQSLTKVLQSQFHILHIYHRVFFLYV